MEVILTFLLFILAVLGWGLIPGATTEYFVDGFNGYDYNPGTLQRPWQNIWRAALAMKAGDICTIRGGQYFQQIRLSNMQGTPDNPIVFRAYPGENVVLEGTFGPITGPWFSYTDNIYYVDLGYDIWQLFIDEKNQVNARWPNAYWYDYSVFDYTKWGFSATNSTYDQQTGMGMMIDNGTHGLGKSGLNATGAMAVLNIGSWMTWAGKVEKHTPGEDNFTYNLHKVPGHVAFEPHNSRYFLEDKLEFLDSPSEWYYDSNTKKLYLWTEASDHPLNHEVTGKTTAYSFRITGTSSWIVLSNLSFFASTVYIGDKSNNIKLDSCHFSYPSYTKRMLGSLDPPDMTTIYYNGPLTKNAGNFSVFNCIWEYADGQAIKYRGADGTFENNLWHHNDFSCVGNGMLFESEGVRDRFIRNTVHSNGPSVGFAPGAGSANDRNLGIPTGSEIQLNNFYDLKQLQNDGAHIQTHITAQNGTIIEYNWCYATTKYGIRFDRTTAENASWGYNGTIRYNIAWGTRGVMVKGDNHHVNNNLAFNNSLEFDLVLLGYPGDGAKGENEHTVTSNNILQNGACSEGSNPQCPSIPGTFLNNEKGDVCAQLRDPGNLDFRPKPNSDYITKGIGPYGKECMEKGGVYWIPGRQELSASMPIPPDGTTTAKCDADLMWLGGYGANTHNVYFGTNKTSVMKASPSSSVFLVKLTVPSNIADPGNLKPSVVYYWRVDALMGSGEVRIGHIWQFECL